MASYYDNLFIYGIVYVVLTGILIKPLFILWLVSLCLARRKNDHARVGFTWMKLVFPFYVLALVMYVVAGAVTVILNDDITSSYDYDAAALLNINARFSTVASTFDDIATALLLVTLVEIGNGFLYILTQTRTGLQKGLRWATISSAAVLVVLSIARLGFLNAIWTKYFEQGDYYYELYGFSIDQRTARKLGSAIVILFWIMTIPLVAFASYVVHRVKTVPLLRSSGVIFLVATILLFIRYTWQLAYYATWVIPDNPRRESSNVVYSIDCIVDPLLTVWVTFVLLVLLFVLGVRKQKGLWTSHQPWMNNMNQPMPAALAHGQGGWNQGVMYPPQQQPGYQQYPPQQYVYAVPQQQQQGWVPQQPHGYQSPHGSSPPYVPTPSPGAQELADGEHREK